MRNTIIILLFALICVSSLARNRFDQDRRRFRPNRDDLPEDPSGDNSWNDEPDNGEDSFNDPNSEDDNSWRRNRHRKPHHRHSRDDNSNNEESNIESNTESNTKSSNNKPSKNNQSNTKKSNNKASNTQPAKSSSSTSLPGHLNDDTFSSTDYKDDALFKQQCLDVHNDERASLGIDPVTYNDDLAAAAKAWAEKLVDAGSLSHSPNRVHVGENVGYRTHHDDVDSTPLLIGAWIAEKKDFENGNYPDISTSGSVHDVGHYSQLIWSTTKEIGCAVVNGDGRDYMCCQYAPSGNRVGKPVY